MKRSGRASSAPVASRRHTRPTAEEAFLSCGKASSGVQENPFRLPEKPISQGVTGFSVRPPRRGDGTEERKRMYINALHKTLNYAIFRTEIPSTRSDALFSLQARRIFNISPPLFPFFYIFIYMPPPRLFRHTQAQLRMSQYEINIKLQSFWQFLIFYYYFCKRTVTDISKKHNMLITKYLTTLGRYLMLMGRSFARPERMRMFLKQYVKEMSSLGVNSIGIVLLISFFIGAVICIQMKLNIQSPWMPRWVSGYTTREILLLEFSSSIMCLILAGKVGSNIASELGTMRVTQQIDALEIMGVNSANYLIMPKILALVTIMPFLVIFSSATGILGAYGTAYIGHILPPDDLTLGLQHAFNPWFVWMSIIKSLFFAFIISSVSSFFGYTVEGGSVEVGKASTDAVVSSSVLILFSDVFLTQLLS